jgi:hypothetical protein
MVRILILSLFMAGMMAAGAPAAEVKEIELTDGSIITGEVLSLSSGVYTIRIGSLGTLKIDDAKIRSIRPQTSSPSPRQAGQTAEIKTLQDKMLGSGEIMGMIESLKDDPEFRKALEDPEILKAVETSDIASLMSNPKFLKLLQNPTVQDIQQKVAR